MIDFLSALRPKQWIKNGFIFLPLLFGKKVFSYPDNLMVLCAFGVFTMASASVYLLNDVLDIENDRKHPKKKLRPIAAGKISTSQAMTASVLLALLSGGLSFYLHFSLGIVIVSYLALNLLYSRLLKHKVIVDVFCIGAFFILRLQAGSIAGSVELSHWILFMTFLLALFLGFTKRRQELEHLDDAGSHRKVLLQYDRYFIDQMIGVVTASIVVVYMLYTVDETTIARVGNTHLIYSIPFVYYGIFRYLYLVHKTGMEGDPTVTLLSDIRMQFNLVLWIAVCVGVIYFGF